jgi:hypothetical protein
VGADLELLAAILIDVRALDHAELFDGGGEGHGARHGCTGAFGGLDDLPGRLVDQPVVVGFQLNPNHLTSHGGVLPLPEPMR